MMRSFLSKSPSPTRRRNGGVLALAIALVCGLGVLGLRANENPMSSGGTGGDTVGSLPLNMMAPGAGAGTGDKASQGNNAIAGPERPAFALTGMEGDILATIVNAFPTGPDGSFAKYPLPNGRVRYEFYGRMTVILNRARMLEGLVRGQTVVGYSFAGGIGSVSVGGIPRTTEALVVGIRDLQIPTLDSAGVLSQGLAWHAVSLANRHRVLYLNTIGNTIRVDQRD
ncbi:MAG: hypothetical protein NTV21_19090 [Planctomycetota bacterium]|nr:hypothetical protein [Planctomycetota bacterium]